MKTTLVIADPVMHQLRQEAAKQKRTISELVEAALRLFLNKPKSPKKIKPLPSFSCGKMLIDVSDRKALYDLFDQEEKEKNAYR